MSAQLLADPRWAADVPASAANPMANRVGWFDLNNINCGLLGTPLGFLVIYVVSLMTKEPSKEMQAFIDEIRKPRGQYRARGEDQLIGGADRITGGALRGPVRFGFESLRLKGRRLRATAAKPGGVNPLQAPPTGLASLGHPRRKRGGIRTGLPGAPLMCACEIRR